MNIVSRIVAVTIVLYVACPTQGHCFDFKGLQLGKPTTAEDVEARLNGVGCGAGANSALVCNGNTTIAEETAKVNIVIGATGLLQRIALTVDRRSFGVVLPNLVAKFGRPTANQRSVSQNAMGAKFEERVYLWRRKGGLELTAFTAQNYDTASISFSTPEDRQLLSGASAADRRKDM